jgi:hypothetical protein
VKAFFSSPGFLLFLGLALLACSWTIGPSANAATLPGPCTTRHSSGQLFTAVCGGRGVFYAVGRCVNADGLHAYYRYGSVVAAPYGTSSGRCNWGDHASSVSIVKRAG